MLSACVSALKLDAPRRLPASSPWRWCRRRAPMPPGACGTRLGRSRGWAGTFWCGESSPCLPLTSRKIVDSGQSFVQPQQPLPAAPTPDSGCSPLAQPRPSDRTCPRSLSSVFPAKQALRAFCPVTHSLFESQQRANLVQRVCMFTRIGS